MLFIPIYNSVQLGQVDGVWGAMVPMGFFLVTKYSQDTCQQPSIHNGVNHHTMF